MMPFQDKKILLLGSNVGSVDIVKYAKKNGAYTIVADFLPSQKSIAKQFSDEDILVSTDDIDTLKKIIVEKGVDAIIAGVSEFNLLNAQKLAQYFDMPFYFNQEQWNVIENKGAFRSLCKKFDVPCPKTYYVGKRLSEEDFSKLRYPLIVKPVDASSSIGINVCRDERSLRNAQQIALEASKSGRIIVEEFFQGDEFSATYTITNGIVTLSMVDNRYPITLNEGATTIPVARVYPSTFIEEYIKQVNDRVVDLCKYLNINTGTLFVQGLYNTKINKFSIFEAGLRCAGEAPYRIIDYVNGVNFMHSLVDYSLLGKVIAFDVSKEDPFLKGKQCCVLSFVAKGGRINKIIGFHEVENSLKSIIATECRYKEGDMLPKTNTLRQIVLRFVLVCNSKEELARDIDYINEHVAVLDEKGDELCLKFDSKRLFNEF